MAIEKLDYSLAEIAESWAALTKKPMDVNDILDIGIDSEFSFFLPSNVKGEPPYPALMIASRVYGAEFRSIYHSKTGDVVNPEMSKFIGRILVPADVLRRIKQGEVASITRAPDMDRDYWIEFTENVDISLDGLVVTVPEKKRFEQKYILPSLPKDDQLANSDFGFNAGAGTYPIELDYALQAWKAVSSTLGKGKPKARLRQWLDQNASNLSNEAKERITIVANWDKQGGATRTE